MNLQLILICYHILMITPELRHLLAVAANRDNILALTSGCDLACIFCSHRFNPPGVRSVRVPPLPMDVVDDLLEMLDGDQPVVIGESTTVLLEGEPFSHPRIMDILERLRKKLPVTPIHITSHGGRLTEEIVAGLRELQPLKVTLSLNAVSQDCRRDLLGEQRITEAVTATARLTRAGIPVDGSIVAMIYQTGLAELEATVEHLLENGARSVRVFLPGFTKLTPAGLLPGPEDESTVRSRVKAWQQEGKPVTCEPEILSDSRVIIEAIVPGSPAANAGLQAGDEIRSIHDQPPSGRTDAWQKLTRGNENTLTVQRCNEHFTAVIPTNSAGPGIILRSDISAGDRTRMRQLTAGEGEGITLICTSVLAFPLWQAEFADREDVHVVEVPNHFFGGNIACAGLLTVDDYRRAIRKKLNEGLPISRVYLPPISFDDSGHDLTGVNYWDLEEEFRIPVRLP